MRLFLATILTLFANSVFAQIAIADNLKQPVNIPPQKPIKFERAINDSELKMISAPNYAGAFSSMTYRGQEYINSEDHGRLFQGAIAFNNRYECNNPTQAGAGKDEKNFRKRSSSKRLSAIIGENFYQVSTQMAYYLRPNQKCTIPDNGIQGYLKTPFNIKSKVDNKTRLSDVIYSQKTVWDNDKFPNIAYISISYDIPTPQKSAVVEALTIHSPPSFTTFYKIENGVLSKIPDPQNSRENDDTIIMATTDGKSAIAFYSQSPNATYGYWSFPFLSKISLVYRETNPISGKKNYSAFWVIGTLDEVKTAILYLKNPQS